MNRAAKLADTVRREVPGLSVELRPVQFSEEITDLEVDGGDWSLYITVAPSVNSLQIFLDDFRFEELTDAEVVQILKNLREKKASIRIARGLFRRYVYLSFDLSGKEIRTSRILNGSLAGWEQELLQV